MPIITARTTFRSKIWEKNALKTTTNRLMREASRELEEKLKVNITSSRPAGRLYRKAPITGRRTNKAIKEGFRPVPGKPTRIIVGYNFHRASACGQPPARDTGTLFRSLKVKPNGNYGIKAEVKAPGVKYLDDPLVLNRLFFKTVCNKYFEEEFNPRMREELSKLKSDIKNKTKRKR